MTDEQHRELAYVLHHVKGKVALSGYQGDLMKELYGDWRFIEAPVKNCHSVKKPRTEILWVNYALEEQVESRQEEMEWETGSLQQKRPEKSLISLFDELPLVPSNHS